MTRLRRWWDEEPVATRIGPALVALAVYLAAREQIDSDTLDLIVALVTILGGGGAVAAARAKVAPWRPPPVDDPTPDPWPRRNEFP